MTRTLTLRLDQETYNLFAEAAKAENRSMADLIKTAALRHLQERQVLDDGETGESRAHRNLLDRLKEGSREARERRGRFVD